MGRLFGQCRRSLETCDLGLLLTDDEVERVRRELGPSSRWTVLPSGLTDAHAEMLAAERLSAKERLARREVAFVGAWSLRKGAADWPEIVRRVRARVPDARFTLLGTGSEPEEPRGPEIVAMPSFRSEELPSLLGGATIGTLPSYAEGWPFGLLEQLAAGLPCVAYDVSGPRTMLAELQGKPLVPPGDVVCFADRLAELLALDEREYGALSTQAVDIARRYRWPELARRTAALYTTGLAQLGTDRHVAA
jgi:glycosyltransferase involved in cell wall biosynthesis